MPGSIQHIEQYRLKDEHRYFHTFYNCKNLKKLELGESIEKVQVRNINYNIYLDTIVSHALPPTLKRISDTQYMDICVYVPDEALEAYKADPVWGKFWNLQASRVYDLKAESNTAFRNRQIELHPKS